MTIKKIFGKIHLWLGLASGLVVLIVALTGCLYVFEEEGRDFFQAKYFYVNPPERVAKKPLQELSAVIKKQFPEDRIEQVRFKEAADAAVIYHTRSKKAVSINPYTADIIGVRDLKKDFFSVVLDMHMHLMMGKAGGEIIKWNVLIFLILCISGMVLWWPKQKQFFKKAASINFKTKNWKRLNWDLHSVLGFYGLVVLIIIALTGMFWAFDSVKWTVAKLTGAPLPQNERIRSAPAGGNTEYPMEAAYYAAAAMHPGAVQTFISNPADSLAPIKGAFPVSLYHRTETEYHFL